MLRHRNDQRNAVVVLVARRSRVNLRLVSTAIPPPIPPAKPQAPISGRYELLEIGGRGGMAVVWRARQIGPGRFTRTVAVKQMHPHLAKTKMYREMFCEEARIGAALRDPNIPHIYDFIEEAGELYLAMEWIDGVDLATYVRYHVEHVRRPTRWDLITALGIGILRALAAAHERTGADGAAQPIVHRDLSPHNVLISESGSAKLIDFGLSLAQDRDGENTQPGVAKGKLAYLSPEIVRGGRATPLSDQFAVGILLWEALSGSRAFDGGNHYETYRRVANAELSRIEELRPDVPPELAEAIHRALALNSADRFACARDMAMHLGEALKSSRPSEDPYDSIARTVSEARTGLGIGRRTQDPAEESPIDDELSGMVELLEEDPEAENATGIRSWVPSLLSRLRRLST